MSAGIVRYRGFSLIEMALILIIIGAVVGAIVPRLTSGIDQARTQATKEMLQAARDEIIGYALQNNTLPAAGTGGTVPTSIATRFDGWDNDILYIPAQNATGGDLTTTTICNMGETTLSVQSPSGNTTNSLAFILASPGRNTQSDITGFTTAGATYQAVLQNLGSASGTTAGAEYDDIVEYATHDFVKGLFDCSSASASSVPPGAEISLANDVADFQGPTAPVESRSGSISVNDNGTIGLGENGGSPAGDGYFCTWYQGDKAGCSSGECDFGTGYRVYYRFVINNSGHGYTFTTMSASATSGNSPSSCGEDAELLGYGGTGIGSPKFAVEYDTLAQNNVNDEGTTHFAPVFWINTGGGTSRPDNRHGVQQAAPPIQVTADYPAANPVTLDDADCTPVCGSRTFTYTEDTTYATRIEVHRSLQGGSVYTYAVNATVVDCTGGCAGLNDLTEDFDFAGSGYAYTSVTLDIDEAAGSTYPFDTMYFGWTGANANPPGEQEDITISDFGIRFR